MSSPPLHGGVFGRPRMMAVVLGLLLVAVFLPSVWCGFVDWDDDRYVYQNRLVLDGLTWDTVRGAWTGVVFHNWAPLTILSYQLDATLFGTDPWGFHLTNVLLHGVSTGLLYLVLFRMTGWAGRSAAATVLWGVHPLRVESVAWIAERKDVLSVLFLMLALLSYERYCRRPAWRRYSAVFAAMLGSLLCKSTLVTLPVLLLLLDVWPLGRLRVRWLAAPERGDGEASPYAALPATRILAEKIPLFATALLFSWITLAAQADVIESPISMSFLRARLPNAVTSLAWYLWKSILPTGLHPACHHLASDVSWPLVAGAAAVLAAAIGSAILVYRRAPCLAWGLCWFLVATLPVIGLVQTGFQSHADRFTYVPHLGLCVAAVWGMCDLAARFGVPRRALQATVVVLALAGIWLTERQIAVWASGDTLWTHVLSVDPGNAVANGKKAFAAAAGGRGDEAEKLYLAALERAEFPWLIADLARLYHARGDVSRMERYRDWAARIAPRDEAVVALLRDLPAAGRATSRPTVAPDIQRLLEQGSLAMNAGRLAEAITAFEAAIEAQPSFAPAHNLAGIACMGLDRQPEAAAHFQDAIRLDGSAFGYRVNLARALWVVQDWSGCLQACREALAIRPDDPELNNLRRRLESKIGDPSDEPAGP